MRIILRIPISGRRSRELSTGSHFLIWRWTIGHYGGYFVDVPAQNFAAFKSRFPRGVFPRKVKEKSVPETMTDTAVIRFDGLFPKSRGRYYQVHFADGTLGERLLSASDILQRESAEKPDFD